MRHSIVIAAALIMTACATQTPSPTPAKAEPAKSEPAKTQATPAAAAPAAEKKAPQCWNGDAGRFENVGVKATIAGVAVECKLSADGKSAQWVSAKP